MKKVRASQGSIELIVLGVFIVAVVALVGWRITVAMNDQADAEDAVATQQTNAGKKKAAPVVDGAPDFSGDVTFKVDEWKVGSKVALSFTPLATVKGDVAYLGSVELALADPSSAYCDNTKANPAGGYHAPLGTIRKIKAGGTYNDQPVEAYAKATDGVKIGDYYYVYDGPANTCSAEAAPTDMQTNQLPAARQIAANLFAL